MNIINYTSLTNDHNETAIIIDPILKNRDISLFSHKGEDLVLNIEQEQYVLSKFFHNHKNIKNFLLIEFGPFGFVSEREIIF